MKKIKQFFKDWWKVMEQSVEKEEGLYSSPTQNEKDVSSQCPFCGYLGSSDEVRCHCLNYHKR